MAVYVSQVTGVPLPPLMRRRFSLGLQNRLNVYDAIRKATGTSVVVDSSKAYLQGVGLYQCQPDRTRLVLIVRDGRAVFYSGLKRGFGRSNSLDAWRNYYRHALPLLRRRVRPEHVMTVRYEDLAADPVTQIRAICAFAGLAYEDSMLDWSNKQHHIVSGNNMRFGANARIRPDIKWRSELTEGDQAFFEKHAGSLNRQLGYE